MRKCTAFLVLLFFCACSHTASSPEQPAKKTPPTPEQMQEAMVKASTIGENHHKLDPLVGSYKVETKFWMTPGGQPETVTGTAEFMWILGGHYLATDYHSEFNGQPFEGHGAYGYNNVTKRYESIWLDSMGTEIMKSEGQSEKDGSVIVFNGEFSCPVSDGPMKMRTVMTIGTDRHVFEMFHPAFDGSGEYKAMEIVYEKVASHAKCGKKCCHDSKTTAKTKKKK